MKSWNQKLQSAKPYQVKPAPVDMAGMRAGQIMLVPDSQILDEFIRQIPFGTDLQMPELRSELAKQYDAEVTCPITTGILMRIVAEAAYESVAGGAGVSEVTPVWRVISQRSPTIKKLTFDPEFILEQRRAEGLD